MARRDLLVGGGALALAPWTAGTASARLSGIAVTPPTPPRPAPIGRPERIARIARAQSLMRANDLGAILVEAGPSLDYFTGVQWGRSERLTAVLIPAEGEPVVVTPFFEKPSVSEGLVVPARIRTWDEDEEPLAIVADEMKRRRGGSRRIGIEETSRFWIADRLRRADPALRIVSANPVVRGCRMVKSAAEIALLRDVNERTLEGIREVHGRIRAGMSGREVSAMLSDAFSARGGSRSWALVLVGPASALPHGTREPQAIARGSIVLIDAGCEMQGYQSDISRTFVFDADAPADVRKVWDQVSRGRAIAMAAARVGASAGSVDDAVRAAYESWGYGPRYALPGLSHRTGHGIGMEGHEPVNLVHGETARLVPGMCFSNEPGIYLPGRFGVRLEDIFVMTEAGPRYFTGPPRSIDEPI